MLQNSLSPSLSYLSVYLPLRLTIMCVSLSLSLSLSISFFFGLREGSLRPLLECAHRAEISDV